jgi:nicotinamidase-related amidase
MELHGLIIDPQEDFCNPKTGALFVPGAEKDMARLAALIERIQTKITDLHVTLDSHHLVDIAHPIWWKDSMGKHPNPFTIITLADVESGKWTTTQPGMYRRSREYVEQLEKNGRYPLCIWSPHCLIGSPGHGVVPELFTALTAWEERAFAVVDYVTKGSNIWTEHYSAIVADVPDPTDPTTQINTRLIQTLMEADMVFVAGEAGSHCLANTVRDIANNFGDDRYVQKLVLLTDATSPVPGFEMYQDDFLREMTARGMQTATTTDFLT